MDNIAKFILQAFLVGALAGCATYRALQLPRAPSWPSELKRLEVDPSTMPFPKMISHKFDPGDGLDMTEVAMLAVANNPDLMLARDDLGISEAQAFASGLLPDPKIAFAAQFPRNGIPADRIAPFDLGLSYDVSALIMRASAVAAAKAERRKTDLVLLWQEWQVIGQARLLFSRIRQGQALVQILQESRTVAALRYGRDRVALGEGSQTLTGLIPDANVLQGIDKQIGDAERQIGKNRHALNALLGLSPDTELHLVGESSVPALDRQAISSRLSELAEIRPDLLALQAGYEAQDIRLRQAIFNQFPAIGLGINRARDNTGINYTGFSISLNLPIFDRNQGNIAVQNATRKRMRDEFQVRMSTASSDVSQLLADQALLQKQLERLDADLEMMSLLAERADSAFRSGDMSLPAFADVENALLSKKIEKNALQESLLEERIALQILVGGELPLKEPK